MGMVKDVVGLVGDINSSQSAAKAYTANDQQLANEEGYADAAAADSLHRGGTAAGLARMDASKLSAEQNVAYANSGVDASTGTAADVQASTNALGEYNAQVIANNAAREAWGHKATAQSVTLKRQLAKSQEGARQSASNIGIAMRLNDFAGDTVKAGS